MAPLVHASAVGSSVVWIWHELYAWLCRIALNETATTMLIMKLPFVAGVSGDPSRSSAVRAR